MKNYKLPLSKDGEKIVRKFLKGDYSKDNEMRAIHVFPWLRPNDISDFVSKLRNEEKQSRKIDSKTETIQQSLSLDERYKEAKKYTRSKDLIVRPVPWNAIVFENGRVLVYNSRCNGELLLKRYKLVIGCKESRASLNKIKKLFAHRLPQVKAYMKNDFIMRLVSDLDICNAITILKESDANEEWGYNDSPIIFPASYNAISQIDNDQVLRALRMRKSQFLDYLVSKQESHRNVVPCKELLSYKDSCNEEDAFIFSLRSNLFNHEVLVLENVNVARSTIAFVIKKDCYDTALRVVFDFIRSNELNKRQRLHYQRFDFSKSGVIGYVNINHSFISEWMYRLGRL